MLNNRRFKVCIVSVPLPSLLHRPAAPRPGCTATLCFGVSSPPVCTLLTPGEKSAQATTPPPLPLPLPHAGCTMTANRRRQFQFNHLVFPSSDTLREVGVRPPLPIRLLSLNPPFGIPYHPDPPRRFTAALIIKPCPYQRRSCALGKMVCGWVVMISVID